MLYVRSTVANNKYSVHTTMLSKTVRWSRTGGFVYPLFFLLKMHVISMLGSVIFVLFTYDTVRARPTKKLIIGSNVTPQPRRSNWVANCVSKGSGNEWAGVNQQAGQTSVCVCDFCHPGRNWFAILKPFFFSFFRNFPLRTRRLLCLHSQASRLLR